MREREMERRYTTEEVAERLRCKPKTVTKWVREGRIAAINLGGNRRGPYVFRRSDLEDFERRALVGRREERTA